MFQTNSLRFRVAIFYALFGAVVSITLSISAYFTVQAIGHRLMDDTLREELREHSDEPKFDPPKTVSIKGYALSMGESGAIIPSELKQLSPGSYNLNIANNDYRVLVLDKNGTRYFMTFDTKQQHIREAMFLRYVVIFAIFMTLGSAAGGLWLAVRITAPISRLAKQVAQAKPGAADLSLPNLKGNDEVGELARAFDRYLRRLHEFIDRENCFTSDVSHELRTPLAIILGSIEVLELDNTLPQKQKERIARIHRAAQDMNKLTGALLLMAREQQQAADELPCRVTDVLHSCVENHQYLIAERPIRMEVELIAEPDLHIERPLLEIVVGNLIRNALYHTKSGFVLLRLEAERLTIQDTGVGMRPEDLARAMDRYYKGAMSAGSGVGLSLVKRICDRYSWRITLNSQEGLGTTAVIAFFTG